MDTCPRVGDVISSPRYGDGLFVVTSTQSNDQSESAWDINATSVDIHARQLNDDGSFNSKGKYVIDGFYDGSIQELFQYDEDEEGMTPEEVVEYNKLEVKRYEERVAEHDRVFGKDSFRDVQYHGHMIQTFIWETSNTLLP
jgi:biotin carboxylase